MSDQRQEAALKVVRQQIDTIDREIHRLLNERARCAQKVAEIKGEFSDATPVFYRPEREAQVLRAVMTRNEGPLPDQEVARIFREVMSACLALEQPVRVAFLGPEGGFTQQAAYKHFGHSAQCLALNALEAVFRDVQAGSADYGVVPIENANEGVIRHALDLFSRYNLNICGEVELCTHHHLLAAEGTELSAITTIYAHPFALDQCSAWLDLNFPNAMRVAVSSSTQAVEQLKQQAQHSAMIGGDVAVDLYDLSILEKNIENEPDSTTRYLIIGSQHIGPSGQDKTSVLLMTHDRAGALYDLLEPFRQRNISLTRVESRVGSDANAGQWESLFYLDFEGHQQDPEIVAVFDELKAASVVLKCLGSYPKAVL